MRTQFCIARSWSSLNGESMPFGKPSTWFATTATIFVICLAQFCLLQLRFCCELLALGCIAIHTDVPQTKKLQSKWNAGDIFNSFEHLKPEFFPEPIKEETRSDGVIDQLPLEGALTKSEMVKMYHFFGSQLHAGTFDGLQNPTSRNYDFHMLEKFVSNLMKLLSNHTYKWYVQKKLIRVIMNNERDGKVWFNELDKVGDRPNS
jgi:hypothetical protein